MWGRAAEWWCESLSWVWCCGEAFLYGTWLASWFEWAGHLLIHLQTLHLVEISCRETHVVWVTPQGRELDTLEPVFLHPLSKNSQQNPEVWKMGREEAGATGRKTTLPVFGTVFLCALWLSMCSLLKWSSSSLKQRVQQISTIHRQS